MLHRQLLLLFKNLNPKSNSNQSRGLSWKTQLKDTFKDANVEWPLRPVKQKQRQNKTHPILPQPLAQLDGNLDLREKSS